MIFTETMLRGTYIIDIEPIEDERGFFARSWCQEEFTKRGLNGTIVQCNISYNKKRGTLRGMHYQASPHQEAKLVRCTRGAVYDVIIDLRDDSETFRKWESFELSADNRRMLYVAEGFAHGFQSLQDDTEVLYQMSTVYVPCSARGIRWDDPSISIKWPLTVASISEKDRSYKLLDEYYAYKCHKNL